VRLTKFVHSCVLVEDDGAAVLFDPGLFSWQSGLVDVARLPELDAIVVTHRHADHCAESFVRALVAQFPAVQWIAPPDAHEQLKAWGVKAVSDQGTKELVVTLGDHAPVEPFGEQVQNLLAVWRNTLTVMGDTHDRKETTDVLLVPFHAPWGTVIAAIELVQKLKPKTVVPIHDWMWNDDWRQHCYNRFEAIFKDTETTFIRPVDGEAFEVAT
jgi:L-ascorbate metabolism protein UlaG (beta-lactamase superfamily)